jgi:hypothetical protein
MLIYVDSILNIEGPGVKLSIFSMGKLFVFLEGLSRSMLLEAITVVLRN